MYFNINNEVARILISLQFTLFSRNTKILDLISSSAAYFYADISFCYHINIDGTLNLKRKHLSVQFRITYHGFLFLLKKQQSALLMSMIKHLYNLVIIGLHFFNMFSLSLFFFSLQRCKWKDNLCGALCIDPLRRC